MRRCKSHDEAVDRLNKLLEHVGKGDRPAFAQLVAATTIKLGKTARVASNDKSDTEDQLQEAYLKIWKHAASFSPRRSSHITWMCTVMRNTAIDAYRPKRFEISDLEEAMNIPDPSCLEHDEFDCDLARPIVFSGMARLSDNRRDLVSLAYVGGHSRTALAKQFCVPVGTIKTWLRRALESLCQDCLVTAASSGPLERSSCRRNTA